MDGSLDEMRGHDVAGRGLGMASGDGGGQTDQPESNDYAIKRYYVAS